MTDTDLDAMRARCQAIWDQALDNPPPMLTATETAAGEWAEQRAEDDAHRLACLEDREEMSRL